MPEINPPRREKKEKPPKKKRPVDEALKYSGIAMTLAITMAIGAFAGIKLDAYFGLERPYLTALCTLLALFVGLYLSLKDLLFNK